MKKVVRGMSGMARRFWRVYCIFRTSMDDTPMVKRSVFLPNSELRVGKMAWYVSTIACSVGVSAGS